MSMRRLVFWIALLAVFAMAARISVDTDTWWHLRAGKWMVENKAILSTDIFSYTRFGEAWNYPGWLVEIPMYIIYHGLGAGGLNLWTAGMVTLAFVFIWQALSGGEFFRAFIIILGAAASGIYWAARPYLVTFVMAALFLWLLEDFRWRRKDRLIFLPLMMVIWANSHGGFVVGFMLWGVYLAAALFCAVPYFAHLLGIHKPGSGSPNVDRLQPLRRLAIIGALLLLSACLTPLGPRLLIYPFATVGIGALRDYIQEWQSPDFHNLAVQPFAWLLLLTLGVVGASRRRLALSDFLLVAGFAYMGLLAGRNVALFALVAPVVLSRYAHPLFVSITRWLGVRTRVDTNGTPFQKRVNSGILLLLIAAAGLKAASIFPQSINEQAFRETLPVDAVHYLAEVSPPGRIFNSYNWGGYQIWALPEYPVFIDGRTDLYNDEIISQWLQVARTEAGWEGVLERYQVNLILIENRSLLDRVLSQRLDWQELYRDELAVIYYRR